MLRYFSVKGLKDQNFKKFDSEKPYDFKKSIAKCADYA
ncbi:hypothetical protein KM759_gp035 [Lymphocystis disease virus 4]|uniref:Uncharacterized protein n=1 Tax=Lymphocystis disease virus 4 TaxID=2704413 RepID=A0A6B9XIJ5_9VIRU|nr:hypothetical protein KM759_gp035 [Lymphocystis disease virus 4]QHR78580.1 hypothetical protein [Lymphocystis disease virus 4]